MKVTKLRGELAVPGSKSHTIRALLLAALVQNGGESQLLEPLVSQDTLSARDMIEQLGAQVSEEHAANGTLLWRVRAIPAANFAEVSPLAIDVGNSGTALYLGTALAALFARPLLFDGDASIRQRSAKNLLCALAELGVGVSSKNFCCPYTVQGPILGGSVSLAATTSQYLSALLLVLPVSTAGCETEINLTLLNERPYIDMTLEWLRRQGIHWYSEGYEYFRIRGGQSYRSFCQLLPADFSSATFFFCAAAITGSTISLAGLDPNDSQGDKQVLDFLRRMGCSYRWHERASSYGSSHSYILEFHGAAELHGALLDLGQSPDALPALAVTCACAKGTSQIYNVTHARQKETDRISCMTEELQELGFAVTENFDGLTINGGAENFRRRRRRRAVCGHSDHRLIMALSILNLLRPHDPIILDDTSYAAVTYPSFFRDLKYLCTEK